ncbi:hypothetical protein [Peribacillus kribbensis]|uniref:hypothetical protein n=1 Tax=Peribacillus kribbensis TaxID=356658 RepID=UPI0004130D69|nr:hypothetical protein [Peribacillus kribbensis]
MKKLLALLGASALSFVLLSACGANQEDRKPPPEDNHNGVVDDKDHDREDVHLKDTKKIKQDTDVGDQKRNDDDGQVPGDADPTDNEHNKDKTKDNPYDNVENGKRTPHSR